MLLVLTEVCSAQCHALSDKLHCNCVPAPTTVEPRHSYEILDALLGSMKNKVVLPKSGWAFIRQDETSLRLFHRAEILPIEAKEEFAALPLDLVLREVHYYIHIPGFRTKQVTLVTTLLDTIEYPIQELLRLYDSRWQVEINLDHLKTTLGMEQLRGKTPNMVRKEIYVYLLATTCYEL